MAGTDVQIDEKVKVKIPEPRQWKVILLNDDSTPMDFVVGVLMNIFKHDMVSAQHIMMQVHEQGSGIAGVYSFEIAESKATEATNSARDNNFPLQIKLEEE
jgi:ATP-dependent Clp protease adaptor protein ClpS